MFLFDNISLTNSVCYRFNPDFTHADDNVVLTIFDQLSTMLYNELIWFSLPFLWYTVSNSLFIPRNSVTVTTTAMNKLERQVGYSFLSTLFYYFIYHDSKDLGTISEELDRMVATALVTAIPYAGLDYYYFLL